MAVTVEDKAKFGMDVANVLKSRGYIPGSAFGRITENYGENITTNVEVYRESPHLKNSFSNKLGLTRKKDADYHLADLWFHNDSRGAVKDKNWIFEVYGTENMDEIKDLAEHMGKKFGVDVKIVLESEVVKRDYHNI